jgi:hypothetical protein
VQQTPGEPTGYWSPDRLWWWDGRQWIPATQAPIPPPQFGMPPPIVLVPSPGLRAFLLVMLLIASLIWGLLTVFGILGESQNFSGAQWNDFYSGLVFFGIIAVLFLLSLIATIGVFARTSWARWAAIAAGIASCLTCLGLVIGIPILVAAARAPGLARKPLTS